MILMLLLQTQHHYLINKERFCKTILSSTLSNTIQILLILVWRKENLPRGTQCWDRVRLKHLHSSSLSNQKSRKFLKRVAISGKIIRNFWDSDYSFFRKLVRNLSVEPQIYLNFPMIANFPRYTGEFLLAERRHVKMFRLNSYVYAWYEWPNLRTIVSCLERLSKLRHFFNGNLPSNNTTKSNQIQQKAHANQLM